MVQDDNRRTFLICKGLILALYQGLMYNRVIETADCRV